MAVEIALLGEVTAHVDGQPVRLGPARQRCVLAALAVDAGRLVPADRLVERVWGADTPRRGRATLHSHISRLRGAFAGALTVVHRSGGYTLELDQADRAVDLLRFRALRDRARRADDDARRVAPLVEALALWRGEPLTGVSGLWAEGERDRWQQERWAAELDLVDARLSDGQGEELVAQLSAWAARHPLDERVAGRYMLALHRAGRTADALAHYRHLREQLVEELGTDPGTALRDLHRRILDTDPALAPTPPAIGGGTPATAAEPVPRQLPAPPRWFTGRAAELARLDRASTAAPGTDPRPSATSTGTPGAGTGTSAAGPQPSATGAGAPGSGAGAPETGAGAPGSGAGALETGAGAPGTGAGAPGAATVVISAIGGAGGVGKTWLALAWAHRHLDRFPDGHLFTDLRGFAPTEQPVAADAALFGFLTALGVAPDRIPADLDARAALYRSLVAGRRMLVVLDNAATAEQVVPLLPGSPTCTVLVTSRRRLASLIDRHGARHLQLDVLDHAEARALLAARLGADRVAAEPDAVDELVELCGGYPLALSITARDAATRPAVPLAEIAAELRELGLEMLDHDTDPAASLPVVLSWSLRRLTDEQRTVFGLLGIAPGPDTTPPAVAALTGLPAARARRALSALEEASLLERLPGGRYAMHDLVRDYAATTAHALPDGVREAALVRVADFHLHTAFAADRLLEPHRELLHPGPPAPGVHPHPLPDAAAAIAWLEAEHATLLATQRAAVALGRHHVVWHLARALDTFHFRRGHRRDALTAWRAALDAAAHLPDPTARSRAHRLVGRAYSRLGGHDEAIGHLDRSLTLAVRHHDPAEQAHTYRALTVAWKRRDDRKALEYARHSLDLYRTLDRPVWEADALNQVARLAASLGDLDTARDHCRAALTLFRRHHDPVGEADALAILGSIAHRTGDHRQSVEHYHQALAVYRTHGDTYQVADALDSVGHPHSALGRHDRAHEVWREALRLYRDQGRDEEAERVRRRLDDLRGTTRTGSDAHLPRGAPRTAEPARP
ncbi:AfsR/SARP family transcriptional regulator [Saccharothrix variisporea]|uniref:AfsR/SARP family transcriptional regulator n=1 Tax=Saccharothrix variisporea TaxID=543527 RepID=UPI001FEA2C49|nr:BTAD domain-containing putative transcriptional regulator [Saccharothrix variisporea]